MKEPENKRKKKERRREERRKEGENLSQDYENILFFPVFETTFRSMVFLKLIFLNCLR